jgi:hypothetical protein
MAVTSSSSTSSPLSHLFHIIDATKTPSLGKAYVTYNGGEVLGGSKKYTSWRRWGCGDAKA